jgi:hypothetical protein
MTNDVNAEALALSLFDLCYQKILGHTAEEMSQLRSVRPLRRPARLLL